LIKNLNQVKTQLREFGFWILSDYDPSSRS